ncbi:uncharacterized protein LOC120353301 isoform X2 [Nilaparvata lugens]|uniref:uncharacterized protein LOC120353301 isoform X2 n=1 Tax=Nilaparvata lugens TaxID=108931 RepID=UPI00193D2BD1|nr:uncharacterized protein LOC120353301 isoform X2 [Nilaparvata lugens]
MFLTGMKQVLISLFKEEHTLTEVRTSIERYLKFCRIYSPKQPSPLGTLIYSTTVYLILQTLFLVLKFWTKWNFNSRVSAIESLNFTFGVVFLSSDLYLMPEKTEILTQMIEAGYYLHQKYVHLVEKSLYIEKCRFIEKTELESVKSANSVKFALIGLYLSYLTTPVFGTIFHLLKIIPLQKLTLPLIIQIPYRSDPFIFTHTYQFLFLALFQVVYILYTAVMTVAIFQVCFLAVNNVLTEIQLFVMCLKEMNLNFGEYVVEERREKEGTYVREERIEKDGSCERNAVLKLIINDISKHHQFIFRKIRILNTGFRYRLFYVNTFVCLQLCFALFCFQSEKLELALYDCCWIAKPRYFSSCLKILMTRTTKTPKIVSFNIFTLNRNNLKIVVQAAYSYFNFLERSSKIN